MKQPERHQKPQKAATAQSLSLLERNSSTNIDALERQIQPLTLSDEEQYILDVYSRLNADGRKYLHITLESMQYMERLWKPAYTKTGNIITLK